MKSIQQNCLLRIRSLYGSMLDSEKKVADLILDNPEAVLHMAVSKIAQVVDVAESSIVRFSQNLGYKGISDMKINLAKSLANPRDLTMADVAENDTNEEIVEKVISSSISALKDTLELLNFDEFGRAVDSIMRARSIWFFAIGTSATIAQDAYYRFMRVGFQAHAAQDPHISRLSAYQLTKRDVAVGISHTGRTSDTIETLRLAKEAGAATICITSFMKSPITQYSDICLTTYTNESAYLREAVSSRIAQIALLDALYTTISLKKHKKVIHHIDKMTEILSKTRM